MPKDFGKSIRRDYKVVDSLVTVRFTSRGVDGAGDQTATITGATRDKISRREVQASEGAFDTQDVAWELPAAGEAWWPTTLAPKPGDRIEETLDEGGPEERVVGYTVSEAVKGVWDTVWRVVCHPER